MPSHRYLSRCSPLRDARCCAELREERRERHFSYRLRLVRVRRNARFIMHITHVRGHRLSTSNQRRGKGAEGSAVGGGGGGAWREGVTPGKKGRTRQERRAFFSLDSFAPRRNSPLPPPPNPGSLPATGHLSLLSSSGITLSIRDVFSRSCLNPRLKPRRQIRLLIINRVGSLLLPLLRPPLFPFFREKVRFGGGRYIVISVPLARHRTGPLRGFIKNYMRLIKTYRPPPLLPSLALVSLLLSPSPRPSGHGEVSPGSERGRLDTSQNQIAR